MKLFLIGMMGSGKTYWAKQLAVALGINWLDLDATIEAETQLSIKQIFETKGEEWFRQKENETLHQLETYNNLVIATGGGTPCFFNNMQWMNSHGTTIFLNESLEVLVKRLSKEKAHRPLIKNFNDDELKAFLEKKLEERKPFYSQANYEVEGNNLTIASFLTTLNIKPKTSLLPPINQ